MQNHNNPQLSGCQQGDGVPCSARGCHDSGGAAGIKTSLHFDRGDWSKNLSSGLVESSIAARSGQGEESRFSRWV